MKTSREQHSEKGWFYMGILLCFSISVLALILMHCFCSLFHKSDFSLRIDINVLRSQGSLVFKRHTLLLFSSDTVIKQMYSIKKILLITKINFFESVLLKPIGKGIRQVNIQFRKRNLENEKKFWVCTWESMNKKVLYQVSVNLL